MRYKRLIIFSAVFFAMNLAFVPLMSLYGLRVCPILERVGYGPSCIFTSIYIGLVFCLNLIFIGFLSRENTKQILSRSMTSALAFGIYILASAVALGSLKIVLRAYQISDVGRAPEILLLASLLLGTTQSYALSWVLPTQLIREKERSANFEIIWLSHIVRTLLPVVIVIGICIHFLLSQSISFNEGQTARPLDQDNFIAAIIQVLGFLSAWLVITVGFFLASERDASRMIKKHIEQIKSNDLNFSSTGRGSWGLWNFILITLTDLTASLREKRELEASLIESSKLAIVGESMGNLAHEIRNPMTVTHLNACKIKSLATDPEPNLTEIVKSAEKIEAIVARQNQIIEGVRLFTHTGQQSDFKQVETKALFALVAEMTADNAEENRVSVKFLAEDNLTPILGNQIQLSQVLINLISNAIDALEKIPEKWVFVSAKAIDKILAIEVTDSGQGVPSNIAESLFVKNISSKSVKKGTGLGLKLCRRIIESHGGKIYLNRERANTTFVIELPLGNAKSIAA